MKCNYSLQINTYENGLIKPLPFSIIKDVEDSNLDIALLSEIIYNLPKEERVKLANLLRQARGTTLTNKMVKEHNFISNTTLDMLRDNYVELATKYPDIETTESMTLIACNNMQLNGSKTYGRCILADGLPVFFLKGKYGVEAFFRYLDLKGKILKESKAKTLTNSLKEFNLDLQLLKKHYNKSVEKLLLEFIDNKTPFTKLFKDENGKVINPSKILNDACRKLQGTYSDNLNLSDLQIALKQAGDLKYSDRYGLKITMKKLYSVLEEFIDDIKPYEELMDMSLNDLQEYLHSIFELDATLYKYTIDSISATKTKEKKTKSKTSNITLATIKKILGDKFKTLDNSKKSAEIIKLALSTKYPNVEVTITDGKIKATTTTDAESITDSDKTIIFKSPYSTLGNVYNFGYNSTYLFSPVNSEGVSNGMYHGAYIYAYYNLATGVTHYAISRSLINPNSYAATYNNLERAKLLIDEWNKRETLREAGLYSIKMNNNGTIKRTSKLEAGPHTKEGQILTVLDVNIPNVSMNSLPKDFSTIFDRNVQYFLEYFNAINDINTLETPEKAAAFTLKFYDILIKDKDARNASLQELITKHKKEGDLLVKEINSATTSSYYIDAMHGNIAYLRYLKNNGNDIDINGKFKDGTAANSPTITDMNNAAEYVKSLFNVDVHIVSLSEINEMENVNKDAKAFVKNGEIYINTSKANLSDLYHEMAHIMLGIVKVKYPDAYHGFIDNLQNGKLHNSFTNNFRAALRTYSEYARQDILEEAVANTIATNLYNKLSLIDGFKGEVFLEDFIKLFDNFPKEVNSPDFSLGFSTWLDTNYKETAELIKTNMRLTNVVRSLMSDGTVIEKCD